jgi:hypothetical protein
MSIQDRKLEIESLWNVHNYINEYVRFADQKASALIGVNSAVVGAMVWAELHKIKPAITANFIVMLITFCLLIVSFTCAWWAIHPRLFPKFISNSKSNAASQSPIFFEHVRLRKRDEYTTYVCGMSEDAWANEIARHCWDLSEYVAHRKYYWIGVSARLWLYGTAIAMSLIVVNLK